MIQSVLTGFALAATLLLGGCGYNTLQSADEQIKASWSEVVNQYQRRADLIPNLVATVKGFAAQEEKILIGVTNARAKVGSIQVTPETVNDPQVLQRFAQAQGELSGALSRLIAVAESYPQLKSDANFRELQAQLGHREPDRGRPQPLHPGGARVQHHSALVSLEPDGDAVRLQGEAAIHGRERKRNREAAQG